MPAAIRAAVSNVAAGKRKATNTRRYVDDPEEQATLLGGDQYEEEFEDESPEERRGKRSPSPPRQRNAPNDRSRTIPFRPPGASYMSILKAKWFTLQSDKLQSKFPPNIVRNQKYNAFTFLPMVFYQQFKFFFNLYFLLVALSQFVPALKIGMPFPAQSTDMLMDMF